MICSPCEDCSKKNMPKEKCVKDCQLLKAVQEMDSSFGKLNEGCGIDYSEEYNYIVPPSSASGFYRQLYN